MHWIYELRAEDAPDERQADRVSGLNQVVLRHPDEFRALPTDQAQSIAGHTGRAPQRILGEGGQIHALRSEERIASQLNIQFARFDVSTPIPLNVSLPQSAFFVSFLYTPELDRGKGYARFLVRKACASLFDAGYRRAYCHIRSTNVASRRAFRRAGWRPVALILTTTKGGFLGTPGAGRRGLEIRAVSVASDASGPTP
ncbi:GNAT family N-acetyltransferase [Thioalkalivibrio sp. ALJ24]|uniref:GNAT family N-acetyltransferase n=1 Tax=Thioalkalivibrio sp. ALJ24 TaxID=545276 RepID=UPI001E47B1E7|nr:GNAT family N-acetyltransferase [Thioalkalivibrio sp. ALJ24]